MSNRWTLAFATGFATLSIALLVTVITPQQAHADGAIGNSGSGSSGGGWSTATVNGFGWYKFTVNSSTHPLRTPSTSPWSATGINAKCAAVGAKSIMVYVIYQSSGGINNSVATNYTYYDDSWSGGVREPGHFRYAPWYTVGQAKAAYDSLTVSKAGYTWGSNVGWFCYDITPPAPAVSWNVSGNSYIQKGAPNKAVAVHGTITAAPGDRLNWYHDLLNVGPDTMNKKTAYQINKTGFSNGWDAIKLPTGSALGAKGSLFVKVYAPGGAYATYMSVTQADVGHTICEDISWAPDTQNGGSGVSAPACATIPYSYTLNPLISASPSVIREGSGAINVVASVGNSGGTTSVSSDWSVTRFILAPGTSYSKSGTPNAPCTQFSGYVGGSCQSIQSGTRTFPLGSTTVANFTDTLASVPTPGSEVCYLTSVSKGSSSSPTWKHSSVVCSVVERIPFVQVLGNDLRVGSAFNGVGNNVTAGAKSFVFSNAGSWVEYGILAPGSVSGIASESGANGGNGAAQSSWSNLTFANANLAPGCAYAYGCFTSPSNVGKIPDASTFVKTAKYNGTALNYDRGSASFSASDIPGIVSGANLANFTKSASITTAGTVTINQDITYNTGTLSSLNDIPQLIIIANNINITGNVKHIDAWLIATGTINTCSDVAQAALRTNNCSNQLVVNGAVMANQLLLDRTYYDPAKPGDSAETLNLRGSSYIWASNVAQQNGQWQTVYSSDLPPRY